MNRLFLPALFVTICYGTAFPQDTWQNYYRSSDIEINYRSEECDDKVNGIRKQLVLFQFVNLTSRNLSVSFNKQAWYNGKCSGCENAPEQMFTVKLPAGQTVVGSCGNKKDKSLYVVDRMLDVKSAVLTKFELTEITVLNFQ